MESNELILKKSGFVLDDGETLLFGVEAELWAGSSNPIMRMIGKIERILNLLVGVKKRGYLLITNKRVIELTQHIGCWVFNAGKDVKSVLPRSIKEVGYRAEGAFLGCFCQAYTLYYEAHTQSTTIMLKGANEEEAARVAKLFYDTVAKAQAHNA